MELDTSKERAFLFGAIYHDSPIKNDAILDELARLVEAAGGQPVGRLTQNIRQPHAATFLGQGKVDQLKEEVYEMGADVAVFDEELSPAQGRNLERQLGVRVIDRSELILDIFASRARTYQAKLQVELAQLKYKLPRLKRMWTHLDRIKSAIGARGPGETQIETDRRLIRNKIQEYSAKLKERSELQQRTIKSRKDFKVSLVGYTNAGKSTLMRSLTDPEVYVADQLFATLDTLTRKLYIEGSGDCLLSDTVGFVDKLPHHLVTSFHATLSEAREADLLLHVVDSSDPLVLQHLDTVERVLNDINCGELPTIVVANKIDHEGAQLGLQELKQRHPDLIPVSAHTGAGIPSLINTISEDMRQQWRPMKLLIPWQHGNTISQLGRYAKVTMEESHEKGFRIDCEVSDDFAREHELQNYSLT